MNDKTTLRNIIILIIILIAAFAIYTSVTEPTDQSIMESLTTSTEELQRSAAEAAQRGEDKTLGEKIDETVKDVQEGASEAAQDIKTGTTGAIDAVTETAKDTANQIHDGVKDATDIPANGLQNAPK